MPPIAKAINYTLRHWGGLMRHCEDGRYLIDNNHTEHEIKPRVIARKNFLFAGRKRKRMRFPGSAEPLMARRGVFSMMKLRQGCLFLIY
jgi:hypothetical protein